MHMWSAVGSHMNTNTQELAVFCSLEPQGQLIVYTFSGSVRPQAH